MLLKIGPCTYMHVTWMIAPLENMRISVVGTLHANQYIEMFSEATLQTLILVFVSQPCAHSCFKCMQRLLGLKQD